MDKLKARIAARCAREFRDGDVVNLGIGLPTLAGEYLPPDIDIVLHSENGFTGVKPLGRGEAADRDVVNASANFVGYEADASFFDSAMSFAIVRGGHLDITVLGALEVDEQGNLANWIVPGKMLAGMGGAMDLVAGAKRVIVAMLHTHNGAHKICRRCGLPYTARGVVELIITEMGVMEITENGILLRELHPEYTLEEIRGATGCELIVSPELKQMEE